MSKTMRNAMGAMIAAAMLAGCASETGDDGDGESEGSIDSEIAALRPGVNSAGCKRSPYNCALHPGAGSQRVVRADGQETWGIDPKYVAAQKAGGLLVVDGNGASMGLSKKTEVTLNYGQTRRVNGVTRVMALSSGVGAAGWLPIDAFVHADSLRDKVGEVNAKGEGLKDLGCYEIDTSFDPKLNEYKVVKGATDADSEKPADYLPKKRDNGKVYANLAFSVPGDALGAPAVDIFPAGTKFQRLDVPTWEGSEPSIDAKLYSKAAGSSTYSTLSSRRMKFVYGYVKSSPGTVRYGWMAYDGLKVSKDCPNR